MNKNTLALIGSFCLAFGMALMAADVPKWAWWCGQAMVIAGPLMMGSRSAVAVKEQRPRNKKLP
jgi:hypothetical protein